MDKTIKVACWPVVRIYMEHKYGSPVKLNFKHSECKLIGKMLTSERNVHFLDSACQNTTYSDFFELEITKRLRRQTGFRLSPTQLMELNTIIKDQFYDHLFVRLDAQLLVDENYVIKSGIMNYCLEMGVTEDDVPYDTIRRHYIRHRKDKKLPIKRHWSRRSAEYAQKMSHKNVA